MGIKNFLVKSSVKAADIEDHEKRQVKLKEYKEELSKMMSWKSMPEQVD